MVAMPAARRATQVGPRPRDRHVVIVLRSNFGGLGVPFFLLDRLRMCIVAKLLQDALCWSQATAVFLAVETLTAVFGCVCV